MKTVLYLISAVLMVTISSCARCYECTGQSSGNTSTYCKGDPSYDAIKRGAVLTDYNGDELTCKAKL